MFEFELFSCMNSKPKMSVAPFPFIHQEVGEVAVSKRAVGIVQFVFKVIQTNAHIVEAVNGRRRCRLTTGCKSYFQLFKLLQVPLEILTLDIMLFVMAKVD